MEHYFSPAKVNFFLRITGKRSDGYHELISLMSPVSLKDTISIDFNSNQIGVICDHPQVPNDHTNIAYQAARLFFQTTGIKSGVKIRIHKCIPVGGGLGGGSSNAATVLMALNHQYQLILSNSQLQKIALSLGADVPFFLQQTTALVSGIGDVLTPLNLYIHYPILIVYPNFSVSTSWAFKNLNLQLTNGKIDAIKSNLILRYQSDSVDWLNDIHNDLEQVTLKQHPELQIIKKQLLELGAVTSIMSGSGSCIIGIFTTVHDCQNASEILSNYASQHVYSCQVLNKK
jgi:4-diphosphocytidyl-2-C-methyl-D-erythritol kinase